MRGYDKAHTSLFFLCLVLVYHCLCGRTHSVDTYYYGDFDTLSYVSECDAFGGNGICDSQLNNEDCDFDKGDCCECSCEDGKFECGLVEFDCLQPSCYCVGNYELVGDGYCDIMNNNEFCLYDGGDCCPCTCSGCSDADCLDPDAPQQIYDCMEAPAIVPPCVDAGPKSLIVNSTALARTLAEDANCSGGEFHVSWEGNVVVDQTIRVNDGTVLNVTGVGSSAELDGNGSTRLFTVVNASLFVSDLTISNGNATGGGAIAASGSTLNFTSTVFTGNAASKDGGAIFVSKGSIVSFDGAVDFFNNNASSGGALYVTAMSNASWTGETTFSDNVGGALSVRNGSMAAWTADVTFSGQLGDAALGLHGDSTAWWTSRATFSKNSNRALFVGVNGSATWSGQTTFSENGYSGNGGAVYVDEGGSVCWTEATTFFHNSASRGGALYTKSDGNVWWAAGTNFSGNIASDEGGAIYVDEGGSVSWAGETIFFRNIATYWGGAVAVMRGKIFWSSTTYFDANFLRDFEKGVGQGGALFVGNRGYASWNGETVFNNNRAGDKGGGVFITRASTLEWSGETNFTSNKAGSHGGAVGSDDLDRSITLSADSATAADEQSSLHIRGKTHFINNNSSGSGGGMVLLGLLNTTFSTTEVVFRGNSAAVHGGGVCISATDDAPAFLGTHFASNSASAGGGMYAAASGAIIDGCSFVDNRAEESGGAIHTVAGVESFENTYFQGNRAQIGGALMLSGRVTLSNCSFLENVSDVDSGPAVYNIGSLLAMEDCIFFDNAFSCDTGTYFSYNGVGHIYETVCAECSCDECSQCENCRFGEQATNVPACETALDHTTSDGGTIEELIIHEGYWRSTKDSNVILECYLAKACRGGLTGDRNYCEQGYEGAYCSVCSEGYSPGLGRSCRECSDSKVGIVLAIVLGMLGAAVGVFVALHLVSGEKEGAGRGIVDRISRIIPLHTLKIVVVAWQIVTQFTVVAHVTYPDVYRYFLDVIDVVNLDLSWVVAIECIVRFNFHGEMIFATMGPLVILGFLGLTYCVAVRIHRAKDEALQNVWNKHMSVVFLLTFLVYSSVSAVLFQMFDCERLDDGKIYLRADYSIECNSAWHRTLVVYSAVMVLLFPVGIPSLYAYLMFKNRDVLADSALREIDESVQMTSGLWKPYKPSRFYYEVIECGRRLLLTGGVLLVDDDTSAQVAVIFMIAVSFAFLHEILSPYESRIDVWVSRAGHAVVYGSMYFALLQKTEISNDTQASQRLFEWVLITTNVLMVAAVAIDAVVLANSSCTGNRMISGERELPVDDFSGVELSIWHMRTQPRVYSNPRRQARLGHSL